MRIDIAEEDLALLFCPEQGGWHPGISTKAFGWIRDPLHGTDAHSLAAARDPRPDRLVEDRF